MRPKYGRILKGHFMMAHTICGILRPAKPPKDNLSKEQRKALKELRSLENEVILPADKENATLMMTRDDYDMKIRGC